MRASTMQLERREAIELVLSFKASLLSQLTTRLSIYRLDYSASHDSELKTISIEKSYKSFRVKLPSIF